jgi:pyruvate,water dikinase
MNYVVPLNTLGINDVAQVGGKNASLGEMIQHLTKAGVKVPDGLATTSEAFWAFMSYNDLGARIHQLLSNVNVEDVEQLSKAGKQIRQMIDETPLPAELEAQIRAGYEKMGNASVAVRSSATAEDLPNASFAGQQETYLNITGIENVLKAVKDVYASLYNDRAIAYREHHGFEHHKVGISVGIQRMVRSDVGASGVLFTIDTESGFDQVIFITASYGLGETVVQGQVNPDEFYVYKPNVKANKSAVIRRNLGSKALQMVYTNGTGKAAVEIIPVPEEKRNLFCINDKEIETLSRYAVAIEEHYGRPMDVEWAKDGLTGELYIVQARPETVKSRANSQQLERYVLKQQGEVAATGRSIGQRIGSGKVKILKQLQDMNKFQTGDVLVTDMTDPDWEPIMKRAAAIVTNRGGRTCHAAIIARELGIPAVVGCGDATQRLQEGEPVTVSCAQGDTGYIYHGDLAFEKQSIAIDKMPKLPFDIMMNVGNPDRAFDFRNLPNKGVGLARLEFVINHMIGIHPKALLNLATLPADLQKDIQKRIAAYGDPVNFYVSRLAEGIAMIGSAFAPQKVIVRLSDFKSNEYANLIGGKLFEPTEENPMIGFRGASRYVDPSFADCFAMECQAVRKVREELGLMNVAIMIPFVRTVQEAEAVIKVLKENGLERGKDGLEVMMMCELPSNALLADEFLQHFDGFSIGSNDLTQLTLGLDRDSSLVAHLFDERNPAIKALLHAAIVACKKAGKYVGICGQGPSDYPEFAQWLMKEGIDSVSLNPDSVLETWLYLAENQ